MKNPFPTLLRWLREMLWLTLLFGAIALGVVGLFEIIVEYISERAKFHDVSSRIVIEVGYSDVNSKVDAFNEVRELVKQNGFELVSVEDATHGTNTFVKAFGVKKKLEDEK